MKLRDELWALEQRFREEAERLKQELGEKLEALKTPPALPPPGESRSKKASDKERPVYIISVAAELVGMHPQTLRLYEREGLVTPSRTSGKTRLYSERDVEELGVNLAGVEEIIRLRDELDIQQNRLESEIARLRLALLRELKPEKSDQKKVKSSAG
jgi:MerR family transcriptional regulator/heat shock protein HspR